LRNRSLWPLKLVCAFLAGGAISTVLATPGAFPSCTADNLADYISNTTEPPATGGCAIGVLDYIDFSYHPFSNAPLASAIQVAPSGQGFTFGPITAPAGQTVQFEIDYDIVIDPSPIITGGDMSLDPPTGDVIVTQRYCNDVAYEFQTGTCLGGLPPETLTVGTPGTGFPSSASITFVHPATTSENVGILFTLTGGATGASFDGLDSTSIISGVAPEPASAASLLFGLLALGGGYKLRKQRNN